MFLTFLPVSGYKVYFAYAFLTFTCFFVILNMFLFMHQNYIHLARHFLSNILAVGLF